MEEFNENIDGSIEAFVDGEDLYQEEEVELSEGDQIDFYDNLVELLTEEELQEIGNEVVEMYTADEETRQDWLDNVVQGMDRLGIEDETGLLFEGSCGTSHPLIIENAVKLQSKLSSELLPSSGPVKTEVLGIPTREKQEDADAIKDHMNWQTRKQMPEFYDNSERNFLLTALVGKGIKKIVFDPVKNRPVSYLIPIDQFVVPSSAVNISSTPRMTEILHMSENDLKRYIAAGLYADILDELGEPEYQEVSPLQAKVAKITGVQVSNSEYDASYTLLEQHVEMFIEGIDEDPDEIAKPYIITVDLASKKVLGIRRNYEQGDPEFTRKEFYVEYSFVPALGFYSFGFIHLLGNLQKTLTAIMRSLVDAGQFANLPSGFKNKNVRITGGDTGPIPFGTFIEVETAGGSIRDAFEPLPYKEPSAALFNMMTWLDGRGQKFADSTENVVADSQNYGPVGTTMALLDASAKFQTALHKRFHTSQGKELEILARLNREYLDEMKLIELPEKEIFITRAAYQRNKVSIVPVSDPNISSAAQRISLSNAKIQIAQQMPSANINTSELVRRVFMDLGEKNIDTLIPPPQEAKPNDPVTDIILASKGGPIKAFEGQDHNAHVQAKTAWLQDPKGGQSPVFANAVSLIQANIQEHMLMDYQEKIKAQVTGVASDPSTQETLMAKAAQVISQNNQAAVKQLAGPSPEEQIARAEVMKAQVDADELDFKKKAKAAELSLSQQQLDLDILKEYNKNKEAEAKLEADMIKERLKTGSKLLQETIKDYVEEAKQFNIKDSIDT